MKSRYVPIVLILLLAGATDVLPQRKAGASRSSQSAQAAAERRTPGYQLYLRIKDGAKLSVSIASPSGQYGEIDPGHLSALITDLPSGGDKFNTPNNVFPKVVVEASPNITMLDFWNPITLFRPDRTDISVIIPGDTTLSIPPAPKADPTDVKPNPLFLLVEVDDAGKLSLNNEPAGSLSDTRPLEEFLAKVFKDRELNGVSHEGTNETETAVTVAMPMGPRKFSDLITVATAVKKAGSKWISLAMEGPSAAVIEEAIPFTPTVPTRRGKP